MTTRGTALRAAAAAACLAALCGCSSASGATATSPATPSSPTASAASADQAVALADGKVSAAEYAGAFAKFSQCATSGGGRVKVDARDPGGYIHYEVGGILGPPEQPDATTVEGRCYHQYLDQIEVVFQTTNPGALSDIAQADRLVYKSTIYPCLKKNNVTAPADVNPDSAEGTALTEQWATLRREGKC